ncbi:MAG: GAF domain-containing protein [Chloroflexi bacterium]|nr:MAG: GAF domain-containing protein [Chloroflexota bacterium]
MTDETVFLISPEPQKISYLETGLLTPAGYQVTIFQDCSTAEKLIKAQMPSVVIITDHGDELKGFKNVSYLLEQYPGLTVIYLPERHSVELELDVLRAGASAYLAPPVSNDILLETVKRTSERSKRIQDWANLQLKRNTKTLKKRLDSLETLQQIGRSVTALLDLDGVLKAVVDAAVELTGAEKGSLLLLDDETGELYMRASRNFNEDFVRTFRLPIRDSLPGEVLRSGKPLLIREEQPKKIKTSYLVYNLIYVPLQVHGRIIGVLGVDNRQGGTHFEEEHLTIASTLGDYASIAIENARLYMYTDIERKKLETILTKVGDAVLVVDSDNRILIINQALRTALNMNGNNLSGMRANEVLRHAELLELLSDENRSRQLHAEIKLEDGRIFNASMTPIQDVGTAIFMQDITHLKEIDRIKSEFVSTVSHDLRSPLTAILGYIELMDRVGKLNDQQREFIRRIQLSVNNITSLINDLLDLGRIEAGFDTLKELVPFSAIVRYAMEGLRQRAEEKGIEVTVELQDKLPAVLGNPIRMRQMVSNLIGNAIKYAPSHGKVSIFAAAEEGQVIFRVEDNGPGIPPGDQPYIFNKFYRASNVPFDVQGTGLGLAIVKSIVENHRGRIWVESTLGQGAAFTVVLPVEGK